MQVRLNDDEIRRALADALAAKLNNSLGVIMPEDCWFEAKAGEIKGDEVGDIHDVEFCYQGAT